VKSKVLKVLLGLIVALIGAEFAVYLKIPLPWMLGPLLSVASVRLLAGPVESSMILRHIGQWGIGVSLGLYFTPFVLSVIFDNIYPIILGMFFALLLGCIGTYIIFKLAKVDIKTAWFSAAIGGASEMTSLSERYGGRSDLVASAHSVRILAVVMVVPFIFQALGVHGNDAMVPGPKIINNLGLLYLILATAFGGLLAVFIRMPNAWVLGPMGISMLLTMSGIEWTALPDFVSKTGQLFIGLSLGDKFRPSFFKAAPRFLFAVLVFTVLAIFLAFLLALLIENQTTVPLPTLMLGLTPGGIAEMAITAKVLKLGVPLVTSFQITRMVLVVVMTGPIYISFIQKYFSNK
jgi:membrane AbrB-like protein